VVERHRSVTPVELMRDGTEALARLIDLLPDLRGAMLVGRKAERAGAALRDRGLAVFASCHPSPNNRAAAFARWRAIPSEWARIAGIMGDAP